MAEGFLRAWAEDRFEVHSAGSQPKAHIHPLAIEVIREIGIDIEGQSPKGVDQYFGRTAVHHVIFVCPRAEKKCRYLYPGVFDRQTWPFEAPAAFRRLATSDARESSGDRDQIWARIKEWLSDIGGST